LKRLKTVFKGNKDIQDIQEMIFPWSFSWKSLRFGAPFQEKSRHSKNQDTQDT
jgi:hypothetical protein